MTYWSLVFLIVGLVYTVYRHPSTMYQYLPHWLRPAGETGETPNEIEENGRENSSGVEINVEEDNSFETETTPKATAADLGSTVPSLSLDGVDPIAPPSTNSTPSVAQSALMPPPPNRISTSTNPRSSNLMLPPARPPKASPQASSSTLRIPSTGPLPNRGPPPNSQQRVNGGHLSTTSTLTTPNPRGKVLLSPGHSPMDWAALTRSGNLSGVPSFQRVTPSILKSMTGRKGKPAWSSWQGKVYNITPYLDFHPGGRDELMKAAGRDGGKLFMEVHPWVNWENMLGTCLVGVLVPEDYGKGSAGRDLEEMD